MILLETSIEINAPMDKVWKKFIDLEGWSEWSTAIYDISCSTTPFMQQGSRFDFSVKPIVLPVKISAETAEVVDHNKIVWRGIKFSAQVVHEFLFEKIDDGVLITSREYISGLLVSLFGFLLPKRMLTAVTIRLLNELKAASES